MCPPPLENKNPINQCWDAMKTCVSFMLVPLLCIALVAELSSDKADQSGPSGGQVRHLGIEHGPLHLPDNQLKSRKGRF